METKICRICGIEKKLTEFEVDSRVKTKRTNRCRKCKHQLDDKASRAFRSLKLRSKELNIPVEVTPKEIRQLFAMFDGRCAYCGERPDNEAKLHLEHIVPLSEHGRNTLANLLPACVHCNSGKGAKPLVTHFLKNREKFSDENFAFVVNYISFLSGDKPERVVKDLATEHTLYLLRRDRLALEREFAS